MDVITIASGMWTAKIAPGSGANIVSLDCGDREILRSREKAADPYTFGMPMLLPANRTAKGKFVFDGKIYDLPINDNISGSNLHGMLHNAQFSVLSAAESAAELQYTNINEIYPFPFSLYVMYALCDRGLYVTYKIKNTGSTSMPLTFGLHTTFYKPTFFSVPIRSNQERDPTNMPTGKYIELTERQKSYIHGIDPSSEVISGYYSSSGNKAHVDDMIYTVNEPFDHWVLYKPGKNADYLCIEPMVGAVNGLNTEKGKVCIENGETLNLHTSLLTAPSFQRNVYSAKIVG